MTEVTVTKLAEEIQIPVDRLLQQFADAGLNKSPLDMVTQREKELLLAHLKSSHGGGDTTSSPNRLTLQRKTRSTLSVSGSGGRSKFIQVEVRKKRTYIKRGSGEPTLQPLAPTAMEDAPKTKPLEFRSSSTPPPPLKSDLVASPAKESLPQSLIPQFPLRNGAPQRKTAPVEKRPREVAEPRPGASAERARLEAETAELKRKAEEKARRRAEEQSRLLAEESRRLAEESEKRWAEGEHKETADQDYHLTTSLHAREAEDEDDIREESGRRPQGRTGKTVKQKKGSKLSESKAAREEERSFGFKGKSKHKMSALQHGFNKPVQPVSRDISIGETITVTELASKMAVKTAEVIKTLMKLGILATINHTLDQESAQMVAEETGHKVTLHRDDALENSVMGDRDLGGDAALLEPRAPVVTIMGHVDHGKTSLLDYIRSTKVAAGEAGGITQHIGAYHVETDRGMITFLDTPGHAAFTAMRSRGAKATDIVILVVAADDGVKPQTIEAIQHARAAQVPIIVAVNKIDKPGANFEQVKQSLAQHNVLAEEWGGDVQFVPVSAKSGEGVDALLEAILLQAEILELRAVRTGMAAGVVIESFLDKGRGPIATVLVQHGTLNRGDTILCGFEYGKVRAMRDELGRELAHAGPSTSVELLGLSGVATAGDSVTVVRDEKKARELASYRQVRHREVRLAGQQRTTLENMFTKGISESISDVAVVLKADVQGSVEAICEALVNLSTDEVKVKIVGSGVGALTETDASLAAASNAILIGFNVRADSAARRIADNENLDLRYYSVIYDILDEVKKAMSGLLAPEYKQTIVGLAEIRNLFNSPKFGTVAGCMVLEGLIKRSNPARILRDNVVIYEGELDSLRRFKDDVSEVRTGVECGIGIKNYRDLRVGDMIEAYEVVEVKRSIV